MILILKNYTAKIRCFPTRTKQKKATARIGLPAKVVGREKEGGAKRRLSSLPLFSPKITGYSERSEESVHV